MAKKVSAKSKTKKSKASSKSKGGRPTTYTPKLADAICAQLAEGYSVRTICKEENMPCPATVFKWLREKKEFSEQYAKAKQESVDCIVEDMLDIADNGTNDWMEVNDPDNPGYKFNGESYQRSRLRVDTRKWYVSKLKPKKYGDKLDLTTDGEKLPSPIFGGKSND